MTDIISDINNLDIENLRNFVIKNKKEINDEITYFIKNIKKEDRLYIVLEVANSLISNMLKYLKYYVSPIFYLHDIPNHIENISNIFPIMENVEKQNIEEIISHSWLYNISYLNFNKKIFY